MVRGVWLEGKQNTPRFFFYPFSSFAFYFSSFTFSFPASSSFLFSSSFFLPFPSSLALFQS
ncbi:hypothetical protein HMPREF0620_0633 [Parascardovia denticolens DSM 10105 = JCM 12538]|uniref:Transmembrane protein n=1 Tax=Parascardovia denticolens DSM 10105 = JCM 12538 TaxID=864564 RepID=E6K1E7_PARDN|nr:hypothetical protein HMPREF0620_0633 [Parascardovia denticolens DSM 10105 = JCM 12538]BAR05508.1 hypothetical protein PSDT_0989 [Parascardovia denticolens DSM 10105 = JCM 12538]